MTPRRVLVVYATLHGQTALIAEHISDRLRREGVFASCFDVRDLGPDLAIESYEGVIVGASLYPGHHQSAVASFLRRHSLELSSLHTAFFSVTIDAAGSEEQRAAAHRTAESFLAAARFQPELEQDLAGAFHFSRAGWLYKLFMRHLQKTHGIDNPWDEDVELTDWAEVDRFTESFLALLSTPRPAEPAPPAEQIEAT